MINKSLGKTRTERFLADLCNSTFLSVWSYPNPFNEEKKEFCDLIAIFENHMFIFFDREKHIKDDFLDNAETIWDRWYRNVIEAQIKTCNGAERYIRNSGKLFLDAEIKIPFPLVYDPANISIHKIIIAHGAVDACKAISSENVNGSLGISYRSIENTEREYSFPFMIRLDRDNPIHVFDSHNVPIIFAELDTFFDFTSYIVAKEKAIHLYDLLSYCGEEDLLAHYFMNYDSNENSHYIGTNRENVNAIMIGEGEWNDFVKTPAYLSKQKANKVSYMWDRLIQKTCANALSGRLGGNYELFRGKSAIYEMAKEPRFSRRALSEHMIASINNFPITNHYVTRNMSFMPSFYPNKAYVFLQLKAGSGKERVPQYREIRKFMLSIACGAAKWKFPNLEIVVGIAVEPPKLYRNISEDFVLFDCKTLTEDEEKYYREENAKEGMGFFLSNNLVMKKKQAREFPNEDLR